MTAFKPDPPPLTGGGLGVEQRIKALERQVGFLQFVCGATFAVLVVSPASEKLVDKFFEEAPNKHAHNELPLVEPQRAEPGQYPNNNWAAPSNRLLRHDLFEGLINGVSPPPVSNPFFELPHAPEGTPK